MTLICVLRLAEFARAASFAVDSWFLRVPAGKLGGAPVGKMAFFTAIAFLAAGLCLAILAWNRRPINQQARNIAGAERHVHWSDRPGFYFGLSLQSRYTAALWRRLAPDGTDTAIGFVLLGTGLAAAAGPSSFPLHRVCGPSIRARLLKGILLPLVVGTVVTVAWLTHLASTTAGGSSTAILSAARGDGRDLRVRVFPGEDCRPGRTADRTG